MAENGFFRTAFRGFQKTDVLNYIDSLHTTHCEEMETMETQCAELRSQNEELHAQLPELQAQLERLRGVEEKLEATAKSLEYSSQRLTIAEEENRQLKAKLAAAEATAEKYNRLQTEVAIQKQQLGAQQEQLNEYENLFGASKDVVSYVHGTVSVKLEAARKRTEETLSAVEQKAAQLEAELQQMREKTAAIRAEVTASSKADEQELLEWFRKLDTGTPAGADSHFFR